MTVQAVILASQAWEDRKRARYFWERPFSRWQVQRALDNGSLYFVMPNERWHKAEPNGESKTFGDGKWYIPIRFMRHTRRIDQDDEINDYPNFRIAVIRNAE